MKKSKLNKIAGKRELTKKEVKAVVGGIETVPLPEFTRTKPRGVVRIGTWPTPE